MYKKLDDFHNKFTELKNVNPKLKANENLKEGDLFSEMHYIYKDKYNEETNSLNTQVRRKLNYKKMRLTDDCQYDSEEEQEQEQTSKKSNKKEPPKKPTKMR